MTLPNRVLKFPYRPGFYRANIVRAYLEYPCDFFACVGIPVSKPVTQFDDLSFAIRQSLQNRVEMFQKLALLLFRQVFKLKRMRERFLICHRDDSRRAILSCFVPPCYYFLARLNDCQAKRFVKEPTFAPSELLNESNVTSTPSLSISTVEEQPLGNRQVSFTTAETKSPVSLPSSELEANRIFRSIWGSRHRYVRLSSTRPSKGTRTSLDSSTDFPCSLPEQR